MSAPKLDADVLQTRLGRRTVLRLLFVGLAPLALFAAPLYVRTRSVIEREAAETLRDYARLTGGLLFETLSRGRAEINAMREGGDVEARPAPNRSIFRSIDRLPAPPDGLDDRRRAALGRGEIVIGPAILLDRSVSFPLVAPVGGGGTLVGVLDPEVLWEATRGGNVRPGDRLYVLDETGRILAASVEAEPLAVLVPGGVASGGPKTGRGGAAGEGGVWAASDVFLAGAFGGERWTVLVTREGEAIGLLPRDLLGILVLFLSLSLAVLVLLSMQGARRLVRPVTHLAARIERIERGAWDGLVRSVTPPATETHDEIDDLAAAFARMAERLRFERETLEERVRARTRAFEETQERLIRSERLRAVGEMGAGVAHELRNRLTVVSAALFHVGRAVDPSHREAVESLERAQREMERAVRLTNSILDFARSDEPRRERIRIGAIIDQALPLIAPETRRGAIVLDRSPGGHDGEIFADPAQIQQVLMNVLLNAVQAMPEGGRISIETAPATVQGRPGVSLAVRDTGTGMDPETLGRIFQPFFSTRADGTGLGLAVAHAIVDRHGGRIEVESAPGRGTTVRILLPVDQRAVAA